MILYISLLGLSIFLAWRGIIGSFRNSKRVMLLLFASWLFFSSFFLLMEQLTLKTLPPSSGASQSSRFPECFGEKGKGA